MIAECGCIKDVVHFVSRLSTQVSFPNSPSLTPLPQLSLPNHLSKIPLPQPSFSNFPPLLYFSAACLVTLLASLHRFFVEDSQTITEALLSFYWNHSELLFPPIVSFSCYLTSLRSILNAPCDLESSLTSVCLILLCQKYSVGQQPRPRVSLCPPLLASCVLDIYSSL